MHYLRGIMTWIDSLESGRQFRQWAAILLKILAVVIFVGISVWGIVICVNTIGASNDSELTSRILVIIVSYFIAEEINVLANIAESLNNIETKLVAEEPTSER
ncbi:hypothetical protein F4X10_00120 [Candidatus Poribacteria bacterium]|nr:hypothetical protein [Candidatus Poribacteria bacterium]